MDEYTDEQRAADRQLLELAAKAAGIDGTWDDVESAIRYKVRPRGTTLDHWDPLNNDTAALRLSVTLQLTVWNEHVSAGAAYCTSGDPAEGPFTVFPSVTSGANESEVIPDDFAATRRAIVRAAAEIGKAMA